MAFRPIPVVALVAVSIMLAGCSVQEPPAEVTPSATAAVDTSQWETVALSGAAGVVEKDFETPAGARSIDLTIVCSGGTIVFVSVDRNFATTAQAGCGSVVTQRLGLAGPLKLTVSSPDGAAYSVVGAFSDEETVYDPAVTADCEHFFELYSAVYNAEDGFRRGATTAADWAAEIAAAGADATAFTADGSELIALQLPTIASALTRTDLKPGDFMALAEGETALPEFVAAFGIMQQVCEYNGQVLTISARYGG